MNELLHVYLSTLNCQEPVEVMTGTQVMLPL